MKSHKTRMCIEQGKKRSEVSTARRIYAKPPRDLKRDVTVQLTHNESFHFHILTLKAIIPYHVAHTFTVTEKKNTLREIWIKNSLWKSWTISGVKRWIKLCSYFTFRGVLWWIVYESDFIVDEFIFGARVNIVTEIFWNVSNFKTFNWICFRGHRRSTNRSHKLKWLYIKQS